MSCCKTVKEGIKNKHLDCLINFKNNDNNMKRNNYALQVKINCIRYYLDMENFIMLNKLYDKTNIRQYRIFINCIVEIIKKYNNKDILDFVEKGQFIHIDNLNSFKKHDISRLKYITI